MLEIQLDPSLGMLARSLADLGLWWSVAGAAAVALFLHLDRRWAARWRAVTVAGSTAPGPYRASTFVAGHLRRAPVLVRTAALSCFALGHLFVPGIVFVLATFRFDGIGLPLLPVLAAAITMWCSGWLLMLRAQVAPAAAQTAAGVSLLLNSALLVMCVVHLVLIETHWVGSAHECSGATVLAAALFAALAVPQAGLVLWAMRVHRGLFGVRVSG